MNPPGKYSQAKGCLALLAIFTGTKCARCDSRRWVGMRREYVDGRYRDVIIPVRTTLTKIRSKNEH